MFIWARNSMLWINSVNHWATVPWEYKGASLWCHKGQIPWPYTATKSFIQLFSHAERSSPWQIYWIWSVKLIESPLIVYCMHTWYITQTGLSSPLGLSLSSAGDVALNLSLIYSVHGQPKHRTADKQGPEGVAPPWVHVKTVNIIKEITDTHSLQWPHSNKIIKAWIWVLMGEPVPVLLNSSW